MRKNKKIAMMNYEYANPKIALVKGKDHEKDKYITVDAALTQGIDKKYSSE